MSEDDEFRRALSSVPREGNPYEALQTLRPRMQRARSRRRAATATIAATLVIGGTAGVMAVMPDPEPQPMRTSMIDDVDLRVEPSSTVTTTTSETSGIDHANDQGSDQHEDRAPSTEPRSAPAMTTPTPASGVTPDGANGTDGAEAPEPTTAPTTTVTNPSAPPTPVDEPTSPPDEAPPAVPEPPPAATSLQTINSACGAVVVLIDAGTVRIQSIQPMPGFEARVSTDGPESIELEFIGSDVRCQLHAELHPDGLEVDVEEPER